MMSELPRWDLSGLFSGIDDPCIMRVIEQAKDRALQFEIRYRGKIKGLISDPKTLLEAFAETESISQELGKVGSYAYLVFSADTSDSKHGAFMQKMSTEQEAISQKMLFFDLELMELTEEELKRLMEEPVLAARRHYVELLLAQRPHHLSEAEEKLMGDKSLTGRQAFDRLFEEELSNKRFQMEGKDGDLSESEVLHFLHEADREVRRRAAEALSKGLKEEERRLAFIFNILVQDKAIDDRYRKFSKPESARHLANQISFEAVEALNQAVGEGYEMVQDFYVLKKKLLGYETLYDYDRYAPISNESPSFTYEEAKETVLKAYQEFSPDFADKARQFFDGHWIDAGPRPGKRGGAFCAGVTPDHHPYVFLNFQGTMRDVMTMAHELGHGIHDLFAAKQSYFDYHPPLTVCETASIFGEMLTFESLKRRFQDDPKALLALYLQKIEEIFASVFRQIAMFRFERDLHARVRERGELSPQDIGALWRKQQSDMFGSSVELTSNYDAWWSYIPHFVGTPFYVYAYAFGELLTLSVFALYREQGEGILKNYRAFLEAGGSQAPNELVKSFGFDLNDPAFWKRGIGLIRELVDEAKKLVAAQT